MLKLSKRNDDAAQKLSSHIKLWLSNKEPCYAQYSVQVHTDACTFGSSRENEDEFNFTAQVKCVFVTLARFQIGI